MTGIWVLIMTGIWVLIKAGDRVMVNKYGVVATVLAVARPRILMLDIPGHPNDLFYVSEVTKL